MNLTQNPIVCPLSGSSKINLIESIKTKDIAKLYQHQLAVSVDSEFNLVQDIGLYQCLESDLKFFYPSVAGTEEFYEQLQEIDWYYLDEKYEYNFAHKYLKKSDHVLEVGCGSGSFAKKISVKSYKGLEFSRKAQLDAINEGVDVLNESIQNHSKNFTEVYDVVCAFQVLEHIPEINSFVKSCLLCLKPGGYLIYSVPSANSFLAVAKNNVLNMPPHHVSWWTDKALENVSKLFNLKLVDLRHEPLADMHKQTYLASIVLQSFSEKFNLHFSLVNCSWRYRFFAKLSEMIASFMVKGLNVPEMLPNGHSVIAIYQKSMSK